MKKSCMLLVMLIIHSIGLMAQDEEKTVLRKIGVFLPLPAGSREIIVRYQLGLWRLEPTLGFWNVVDSDDRRLQAFFGGRISEPIIRNKVIYYPGVFYFVNGIYGGDETYDDRIFGLMLGFEYLFSSRFSINAETTINIGLNRDAYSPSLLIANTDNYYSRNAFGLAFYF